MKKTKIPKHVSWQVKDAWQVMPPCTLTKPYCHVDCPYYYECNPPDDDFEFEENYTL